ncbi:LA_2272 family surface repeat-containing protein [Sediminitomix flava]|uniref:Uncharacterized protein n=1 Tax=Sediminitomix flava TaxID=379075 RepID=A0A315Z199_SEDFL|nr:hypothetical protein [Sediminitomix flava]PWJ36085.1 hypothetical protein BC781_109101 [Sediminitomix flava]
MKSTWLTFLLSITLLANPFSIVLGQEKEEKKEQVSDFEYLKQLFIKQSVNQSDSLDTQLDSTQSKLNRFYNQMALFKKRNGIDTDTLKNTSSEEKATIVQKPEAEETKVEIEASVVQEQAIETESSEELKYRPAQLSFLYPIGTNGISSEKYNNGISINAIAGYNGGLQGIEFGSVVNITNQVTGFQVAGVSNISESLRGVQISVVNITKDATGGQFGILNESTELKGSQIGVINRTGNMKGAQFGLINRSKNSTGAMVGLINVADSLTGAPIGLINVIRKNGFRGMEFSYTDSFQLTGTYKVGVDPFYTMIGFGYQKSDNDYERWGIGLGIGSQWKIAHDGWVKMGIEAMTYQVAENEFWTNQLNLLNQMRLNFAVQLSGNTSLIFGPSFNLQIRETSLGAQEMPSFSESNIFYNRSFQTVRHSHYDPWTGEQIRYSSQQFEMNGWFGFHAGIRFHNKRG